MVYWHGAKRISSAILNINASPNRKPSTPIATSAWVAILKDLAETAKTPLALYTRICHTTPARLNVRFPINSKKHSLRHERKVVGHHKRRLRRLNFGRSTFGA